MTSITFLIHKTFLSYYVCTHCSTKESAGWHHAGPKKYLLCDSCRLYFNKYGEMRPLKGRRIDYNHNIFNVVVSTIFDVYQ